MTSDGRRRNHDLKSQEISGGSCSRSAILAWRTHRSGAGIADDLRHLMSTTVLSRVVIAPDIGISPGSGRCPAPASDLDIGTSILIGAAGGREPPVIVFTAPSTPLKPRHRRTRILLPGRLTARPWPSYPMPNRRGKAALSLRRGTRKARRLTAVQGYLATPLWSRDGRSLAVLFHRGSVADRGSAVRGCSGHGRGRRSGCSSSASPFVESRLGRPAAGIARGSVVMNTTGRRRQELRGHRGARFRRTTLVRRRALCDRCGGGRRAFPGEKPTCRSRFLDSRPDGSRIAYILACRATRALRAESLSGPVRRRRIPAAGAGAVRARRSGWRGAAANELILAEAATAAARITAVNVKTRAVKPLYRTRRRCAPRDLRPAASPLPADARPLPDYAKPSTSRRRS